MRFRFDDEQLAMRDAVRAFCQTHFALADVAGREGKPADAGAWRGLAELGVLAMLAGESGGEVGTVEAALVFAELGAHLASGPALWSAIAAPFVRGVADGDVRVAGVEVHDRMATPVVVEHADECDVLLVLHHDHVSVVQQSELPRPVDSTPMDPLTPVAAFPSVPAGEIVGDGDVAQRVRRHGEVLSAAMLVGVAQGALDVARDYALERVQFGVPIGSFQAIKHLLADMYVRVELARASTYAAAAITANPRTGHPERAAAAAKVLAGEAGIENSRAAVQILGGMGFTWEMLPHYFLKRAWVLEHAFGTAPSHAALLGTAVGAEVTENATGR